MKIRDLADFFSPKQNTFHNHLQPFPTYQPESATQQSGVNLKTAKSTPVFKPATNINLLKFIICEKISFLDRKLDQNIIIQFTKRTRLKQQKNRTKFEELPEVISNKYKEFGTKILNWLISEFNSPELNKIIIDRLPKHKNKSRQVNLRITFYYQNHPKDLNLKVTSRPDNLKKLKLKEVCQQLRAINNINLDSCSLDSILIELNKNLAEIKDKRTIQKLFKCLVGFKPYYLLAAEPEPLIANFTKLNLPTDLTTNYYHQGYLVTHFNNDCHLIAEMVEKDERYLKIDFETLPNELELMSF